jgi:hypothetical protein
LLVSGDPSVPGSADSVPLHLLLHGWAAAVSCSLSHRTGHRLPSRPGCHRTRWVASCILYNVKPKILRAKSLFFCLREMFIGSNYIRKLAILFVSVAEPDPDP